MFVRLERNKAMELFFTRILSFCLTIDRQVKNKRDKFLKTALGVVDSCQHTMEWKSESFPPIAGRLVVDC